jgi:hypothetical protein
MIWIILLERGEKRRQVKRIRRIDMNFNKDILKVSKPQIHYTMKTMIKMFRAGIVAGLMVLALLMNTHFALAHDFNNRGCAWPILMSPEGVANFQFPDNSARYWVMPFDTAQFETMTIKGAYPKIRYFSFTAYDTIDYDAINNTNRGFDIAGSLHDAQIAPDKGSINPFVPPGGPGGTYTIVISRTGPSSGNTIAVPANHLVWVVMRMYIANADPSQSGQSLMGGVPLPVITLKDQTGASRQLEACSPINKWSDLSAFVQFLFPPAFDPNIDEGKPSSDRLWFAAAKNPPSILWPNPDGKYMMMWPGDYQPGRIIVIHGKSPGFPDTFNGSPIWAPARGFRSVDMRYWAACNGNFASPISVVDCATDLTTRLEGGYYTIVMSDDRQRPDWLRPNINWLPWGDEQYPKLVVFRNMLPASNFHHAVQDAWAYCGVDFDFTHIPDRSALDEKGPCSQNKMGDYYPVAVWCDKSTFIHGGWQACIKKHSSLK